MRKRTSSGLRRQFSVENAYAESHRTPMSMQPAGDVHERRLAHPVPLDPRQPPRVGPAPVAVHDQRDVVRGPARAGSRAAGRRWGAAAGVGARAQPTNCANERRHRSCRVRVEPAALERRCVTRPGVGAAPPAGASAAGAPGATAGARRPGRWSRGGSGGGGVGDVQSPCNSASSSTNVSRAGVTEPGGRHRGHTAPPRRDAERPVRARRGAAGAVVIAGAQPGVGHRAQEEGVEHQRRVALAVGERPDRADDQQVHPQCGLALLGDQPVRGLQHRAAGGVAGVVADEPGAERVDGLRLRDDVQLRPV